MSYCKMKLKNLIELFIINSITINSNSGSS